MERLSMIDKNPAGGNGGAGGGTREKPQLVSTIPRPRRNVKGRGGDTDGYTFWKKYQFWPLTWFYGMCYLMEDKYCIL
jgi:hypothetical protein